MQYADDTVTEYLFYLTDYHQHVYGKTGVTDYVQCEMNLLAVAWPNLNQGLALSLLSKVAVVVTFIINKNSYYNNCLLSYVTFQLKAYERI